MIVSKQMAAEYFQHPNSALDGAELPDGVEYWANGDVCLAFHPAPWFDVWMVHVGAKRRGWGRIDGDTMAILDAFWIAKFPKRIVAWVCESNRAVISFAKRLGFVIDGQFPEVLMMGWQKCQ